jgi:GTP cyclohydrolase I
MTSENYVGSAEYNEGFDLPGGFDMEVSHKLMKSYKDILGYLGEDPEREGLLDTPRRMARSMQYLTHGYKIDPKKIIVSAKFNEE